MLILIREPCAKSSQHKLLRQQFLKIKLKYISLFYQSFEIRIFAGLKLIQKSKIYTNKAVYLASNLWCSTVGVTPAMHFTALLLVIDAHNVPNSPLP
jgi:hypothetical protein